MNTARIKWIVGCVAGGTLCVIVFLSTDMPNRWTTAGQLRLSTSIVDLGFVAPFQRAESSSKLSNIGSGRLEILRLSASCGCTHVSTSTNVLNPGESCNLQVELLANNNPTSKVEVWVETNSASTPTERLVVHAKHRRGIWPLQDRLTFTSLKSLEGEVLKTTVDGEIPLSPDALVVQADRAALQSLDWQLHPLYPDDLEFSVKPGVKVPKGFFGGKIRYSASRDRRRMYGTSTGFS